MGMKTLFQPLLWLYNVICQQLLHICLEKMGATDTASLIFGAVLLSFTKTLKIEFYSSEVGSQSCTVRVFVVLLFPMVAYLYVNCQLGLSSSFPLPQGIVPFE